MSSDLQFVNRSTVKRWQETLSELSERQPFYVDGKYVKPHTANTCGCRTLDACIHRVSVCCAHCGKSVTCRPMRLIVADYYMCRACDVEEHHPRPLNGLRDAHYQAAGELTGYTWRSR